MANSTTGKPCPVTATLAGAKDPSGNLQPLNVDGSGQLKIAGTISATNPSTGATGAVAPTQATEVGGVGPDGNLHALSTDNSGQANVNVVSTVLASGAATAANQTTGNTSLASIDAKTPALSGGNVPVQLPSSQITALTPPTTVTANQGTAGASAWKVDGSGVTQPVSGTVSVSNFPSTQSVSGTVSVSNFPGTQPVSGTVAVSSLPAIPTGSNVIGSVTQSGTWNVGTVTMVSSATITPTKGTLTDNSGTTSATPSTSTQVMAANASRKYLLIQNCSSTATIWINFTSAATAGSGSFPLGPLGSLVQENGFVSTEAITVLSTTASVPFTAKQA